jgi:hypothetical protein
MTAPLAAAHTTEDVLQVILSYWWLILIFGGAVLEWIGEQSAWA